MPESNDKILQLNFVFTNEKIVLLGLASMNRKKKKIKKFKQFKQKNCFTGIGVGAGVGIGV